MTDEQLQSLLSEKETQTGRDNAHLVLSPDITRNAAQLKKLRRDRRQAVLCAAAGIVFLLTAGGLAWLLKNAAQPEPILKSALTAAGSSMLLTLLLAPFLAWYSDEDRKSGEA